MAWIIHTKLLALSKMTRGFHVLLFILSKGFGHTGNVYVVVCFSDRPPFQIFVNVELNILALTVIMIKN